MRGDNVIAFSCRDILLTASGDFFHRFFVLPKYLGLPVPQKVTVEQWQFRMERREQRITISFDDRPLSGPIEPGVWGATEQKTGLRNDRYSSSGASGLRRGRN